VGEKAGICHPTREWSAADYKKKREITPQKKKARDIFHRKRKKTRQTA